MKDNLVIVESPAKAKTIERFLGEDYKVTSSYGHIRDLRKKGMGIDDEFAPQYEVPADKQKVVGELRRMAKGAKTVWLASDEDREGEAISWHLKEVLDLDDEHTKRIVFHEITKPAILAAIENPRKIDTNLVNAQQARRVLDRMVGFMLSPVLWHKVRPSLSAGRVQSVAVRLIVEKEREVNAHEGHASFRVSAVFLTPEGQALKASLAQSFATEAEAATFIESLRTSEFTVTDLQTKPLTRTPAAPFTTSTLQQEAAHKLRFTVAQTMSVAQRLYERGHITYMRTDSTNLSQLALGAAKKYIEATRGKEYVKTRQYQTRSKGAQEAHEAIRPTYIDHTEIEGTAPERKLYDLIWKRTVASQMANAQIEKTTVSIGDFTATGEVVKFDGFLSVYIETNDDDTAEAIGVLPPLTVGQQLTRKEITATQKYSQRPSRYNEASLVRKLEELGIGRPSTYATTITTIQQRNYVEKADKAGELMPCVTLTLRKDKLTRKETNVTVGSERGKLVPTDVGTVVNDFLTLHFPSILDYGFTAAVEQEFDEIAEGKADWRGMIRTFHSDLDPMVSQAMTTQTERRVGERVLGNDPTTGLLVLAKIGRFGPIVQIGTPDDGLKPRFASLGKGQSLETITLTEALDLFRLPRELGSVDGEPVVVNDGRYGPYVLHKKKFYSLPKGADPMATTLQEAIEIMRAKEEADANRQIQRFSDEFEIQKGRFGPYIIYKGTNYRIPKELQARAAELTEKECLDIIEAHPPQKTPGKGRKR